MAPNRFVNKKIDSKFFFRKLAAPLAFLPVIDQTPAYT
jgi:hypothetical protein